MPSRQQARQQVAAVHHVSYAKGMQKAPKQRACQRDYSMVASHAWGLQGLLALLWRSATSHDLGHHTSARSCRALTLGCGHLGSWAHAAGTPASTKPSTMSHKQQGRQQSRQCTAHEHRQGNMNTAGGPPVVATPILASGALRPSSADKGDDTLPGPIAQDTQHTFKPLMHQ